VQREDKQRAKAFRDSKKTATPLWEEDGVQRGLLHKYDEEEEEALRLDGSGAVAASAASAEQRQGDIRARLAAAAAASAAAAAAPPGLAPSAADFYTAEEVAAAQKPRKKKERRLKKRALTAEELAELEAGAAARGGADLGSRAEREGRAGAAAAGLAAADAGRRARFEAALTKANYASLALRDEAGGAGDGEEGEEDDDLYRSLNKCVLGIFLCISVEVLSLRACSVSDPLGTDSRPCRARQLAQRSERPAGAAGGQQRMAEEVVRRREGGGGGGGGAAAAALGAGALTFTDVAEFARTIAVKTEAGPAATARQGEEGDVAAAAAEVAAPVAMEEATDFSGIEAMEEDGGAGAGAAGAATAPLAAPAAPPPARAPSAAGVWGSWAPAGEGEGGEGGAAAEEAAPPPPKRQLRARRKWQDDEGGGGGGGAEPDEPSGGLATEKAIGAGLAGALAFLKDRGELGRPVEWAGRTNDSRDAYFTAAMGGYKDVYTGGRTEDQVALGVEVALTRRDEYGRVLTPKEAFRQLCHRFHGIAPSKDTREKRAKQVTKELSQRKAATGGEGGLTAGARAAAEQGAVPYVALSGTVRPGQSRDAAGGTATVERAVPPSGAATPMLGGGQTPLVGRAKVEAMMGLGGKRPAGGGGASMPPPPPKVPRRK
jgi:U4/U6.U5 tri-snRNP-associated protein 1